MEKDINEYNNLKRLGGKGYSDVVKKLDEFYNQYKQFPRDIGELDFESPLTNSDLNAFEKRGKLERKLNTVKKPRLMLIKTHDKKDEFKYLSDNNQIIFTDFRYELNSLEKKDDLELGFICIKDDSIEELNNHCPRSLGTNARILYIRPDRILKELISPCSSGIASNNSGTLVLPIYQLEDVKITPEEIINELTREKVEWINIRRIKSLLENSTQNYLRDIHNSKMGITPREVRIVHEEFMCV